MNKERFGRLKPHKCVFKRLSEMYYVEKKKRKKLSKFPDTAGEQGKPN